MTDRFIKLVAVKHRAGHDRCFLFEAPQSCVINKGDIVMVETQYGEDYGRVTAINPYVLVGSFDYNFAVDAMGATEPLKKVIGVFAPCKYEEDDND